ncbi:hypothetical protein WDZ92_04090, partial [Nostoc sp. NIES-2111]
AFMTICYQNGNYCVYGELVDSTGRHTTGFKSSHLTYDPRDKVLFFKYKYYDNKDRDGIEGLDQIYFSTNQNQIPDTYHGFYINYNGDRKKINILGTRINDGLGSKSSKFESMSSKIHYLRRVLAAIEK